MVLETIAFDGLIEKITVTKETEYPVLKKVEKNMTSDEEDSDTGNVISLM